MSKPVKNAVIYARYSSHGQTEQSIDGQLRDCYAYAEREGYTVVKEYIDRALTGRSDDRPDFQRMIADAPKRQFCVVIVWKLDRFSRNRFDSANYKHILKKYGVRVVSATENISDNPEGIMLEGMLESLAEYYSANLSKHVKRGMRESAMKGAFTGGTPPFGFKVMDKKLVADEQKAPIIRWVFQQYAAGMSKAQIMQELNARGVKNIHGRPMTINTLQNALRNRKYIGVYQYDGQEIAGGCEAIVDEATFQQVQKKLDARKRAPGHEKARQEYLLQGKAFCGYCGTPLVGDAGKSKTGRMYYYYACRKRKKQRDCKKLNEKKDFLEWYIVEQTIQYVLTPPRMDYIASRLAEQYEKELGDGKIRELERQIDKLEGDLNKAVDASIEAPTPKARQRFFDKIEELEVQKADLEQDLVRLRLISGIRYSKAQIIAWMKTFCDGDPCEEDFRRRIIDVFISSIYVYDDKIIIYYNVKEGKQISFIEVSEEMEGLTSIDDDSDVSFCDGKVEKVRISDASAHQKQAETKGFQLVFLCSLILILLRHRARLHAMVNPQYGHPSKGGRPSSIWTLIYPLFQLRTTRLCFLTNTPIFPLCGANLPIVNRTKITAWQ